MRSAVYWAGYWVVGWTGKHPMITVKVQKRHGIYCAFFCSSVLGFLLSFHSRGMERTGFISLALVIINILVSWKGFRDPSFFHRYSFNIPQLRLHQDYKRFFTSGFLHSGWMHLIFNMVALYSFGGIVENAMGEIKFICLYFSSLLFGNLLSLFVNRNKSNYTAIGASGAISGVVFAGIAMFPDMKMGLLFIPIHLPGWMFGLLYVLYCMFGIRGQNDNIGHEAHLGGGISGLILTVAMYPRIISYNYFPILLILIPSLVFLYLVFTRPAFLLLDRPFAKNDNVFTIEDRYNSSRRSKEMELDRLLDKISTQGINSLSKKEKERLEELSKVK
jgi:membrane associated rhomboid family serine protease